MDALSRISELIECYNCKDSSKNEFLINFPCCHLVCTMCQYDKKCGFCGEKFEKSVKDNGNIYKKLKSQFNEFKDIFVKSLENSNNNEKDILGLKLQLSNFQTQTQTQIMNGDSDRDRDRNSQTLKNSQTDKSLKKEQLNEKSLIKSQNSQSKNRKRKSENNSQVEKSKAVSRKQRSQTLDKIKKKNILFGGISGNEKEEFKKIIKNLKGKYCDEFSISITHMVVQTNEENICARTIKYLYAISLRCFVVNKEWLKKCNEKGEWIDEMQFIIKGCKDSYNEIPKMVLIDKENKKDGIFKNVNFFINDELNVPSNQQIQQLIELCDGKMIDTVSKFKKQASNNKTQSYYIMIYQNISELSNQSQLVGIYKKSVQWILKCTADMNFQLDLNI